MGILALGDESKQDTPMGGVEAPSTTFGDVVGATLDSTARNYLVSSETIFNAVELENRNKKYTELTGRSLVDDAIAASPNRDELTKAKAGQNLTDSDKIRQATDAYLSQMRAQDQKYSEVLNSEELSGLVKQKALESAKNQAKTVAGATGASSLGGQLVGGFGAQFADPVSLALLPVGAGFTSGILKTALVEAGVNMAGELATYPVVQKWQTELGQEYGTTDLAKNLGFAGLFGFGFGAGGKAVSIGLEKLSIANSAKLAIVREQLARDNVATEIKSRVLDRPDLVDELVQALRYEERRLNIAEVNPSRYADDIDVRAHERALKELDAAINEERALDPSRVGVTDAQIRNMDPKRMDPDLASFHAKVVDDAVPTTAPEVPKPVLREGGDLPKRVQNPTSELFDTPEPVTAEVVARQTEVSKSGEYKAAREKTFKDFMDTAADDTPIFVDGQQRTMKDFRSEFANERALIDAITTCGIGGG